MVVSTQVVLTEPFSLPIIQIPTKLSGGKQKTEGHQLPPTQTFHSAQHPATRPSVGKGNGATTSCYLNQSTRLSILSGTELSICVTPPKGLKTLPSCQAFCSELRTSMGVGLCLSRPLDHKPEEHKNSDAPLLSSCPPCLAGRLACEGLSLNFG